MNVQHAVRVADQSPETATLPSPVNPSRGSTFWMDRAACQSRPPGVTDEEWSAVFFPPESPDKFARRRQLSDAAAKYEQARAVCAQCPVRRQCLESVLDTEGAWRWGMWGGLTPDERDDEMAKRRRRATLFQRLRDEIEGVA